MDRILHGGAIFDYAHSGYIFMCWDKNSQEAEKSEIEEYDCEAWRGEPRRSKNGRECMMLVDIEITTGLHG